MTLIVGVIAEDLSDVEVLKILIGKVASKSFKLRRFVGFGCGKIKRKCHEWAVNLKAQGCTRLIVLHDLDVNNQPALLASIAAALGPSPISKYIIVIPVHEIEAWLMADHEAVNKALKLRKAPKKIPNPESWPNAKEKLRDYVAERSQNRVEYLNTAHNTKIALHCKVVHLKRCNSFHSLEAFVRAHL